jgi:ADP-ribose pyrophosphatase YjhB (NUDIX family)
MHRILDLGKQKPYDKEPPNAWVFRVLDLDPKDSSGKELRSYGGRLYYGFPHASIQSFTCLRNCSYEVQLAIESWMEFTSVPDDHSRAALIVILDQDERAILLQRKDLRHPNPACRGRYSLFGGSPHIGETIHHAALRELLEEIREPELERYLDQMKHVDDLILDSVQWPGEFVASIFFLPLPNTIFMKLAIRVAFQNNVSESVGALITRTEFNQIQRVLVSLSHDS